MPGAIEDFKRETTREGMNGALAHEKAGRPGLAVRRRAMLTAMTWQDYGRKGSLVALSRSNSAAEFNGFKILKQGAPLL